MVQTSLNIIVGSKYEDTKKLLMHKLQINQDVFMTKPEDNACYFCLRKIQDNMIVVSPREENFDTRYFIDLSCYINYPFREKKGEK